MIYIDNIFLPLEKNGHEILTILASESSKTTSLRRVKTLSSFKIHHGHGLEECVYAMAMV